jgi:hypothetical protein
VGDVVVDEDEDGDVAELDLAASTSGAVITTIAATPSRCSDDSSMS